MSDLNCKPVLLVFGDRTAAEVLESVEACGSNEFERIEKIFFDEDRFSTQDAPLYNSIGVPVHFNVGVANLKVRRQIAKRCLELNWKPQTVIHPSAVVSPTAVVEDGVFVGPMAVISTNAKIGRGTIVHIHASVGHDAEIGADCSILPGARISGHVNLGSRVLIGSNAFVAANTSVGDDSQVDALTYVRRNIGANCLVSVRAKMPLKRVNMNGLEKD